MSFTNIDAFIVLAVVYYIGEFVGKATKAWIPSVFVTAALFMVGYWTIFPYDIVDLAGLGAPLGGTLGVVLCIVHMGTVISIKQLLAQWKTIAIALAGLAGMVALSWIIAKPIIGDEYLIAGLPSLTGGIVAATMMQAAAYEKGLIAASVFAIAMYSVQGFAGYPLTSFVLKSECKKLLEGFRSGAVSVEKAGEIDETTGNMAIEETVKKKLIPAMPDSYVTPVFIFGKLMMVGWIAYQVGVITGISMAVWCLIFGIVFTELGFLEPNSLVKSQGNGFLMYVLMIYVFAGLKDSTPEMMLATIGPMLTLVVIGVAGMTIACVIAGKILGVSWQMSMAVSLTALYGFPPNQIITEEVTGAVAETPEERAYLLDCVLPQMIVGGFTTVTIASVLIAGVFVNLI